MVDIAQPSVVVSPLSVVNRPNSPNDLSVNLTHGDLMTFVPNRKVDHVRSPHPSSLLKSAILYLKPHAAAEFERNPIPDLARERDSDRGYFACCHRCTARSRTLTLRHSTSDCAVSLLSIHPDEDRASSKRSSGRSTPRTLPPNIHRLRSTTR